MFLFFFFFKKEIPYYQNRIKLKCKVIYTPVPFRRFPRLHRQCAKITFQMLNYFYFWCPARCVFPSLAETGGFPASFLEGTEKSGCFGLRCFRAQSIYFHRSVDLAHKHVGCIEANGSRQEPEGQHHEGCVTKVQQRGDELHNVQLEEKTTMRPGGNGTKTDHLRCAEGRGKKKSSTPEILSGSLRKSPRVSLEPLWLPHPCLTHHPTTGAVRKTSLTKERWQRYLIHKVEDCIDQDIEGGSSRHEKSPPPPPIILPRHEQSLSDALRRETCGKRSWIRSHLAPHFLQVH